MELSPAIKALAHTAPTVEALLPALQAVVDNGEGANVRQVAEAHHSIRRDGSDMDTDNLLAWRESALDSALPARHIDIAAADEAVDRALYMLRRAAPYTHVRRSNDGTMWSFFASDEHAHAGRRTATRPARLLTRYRDAILAQWASYTDSFDTFAAEAANDWTLSLQPAMCAWAEGADEIAEVYRHGPSSCMSGLHFDSSVHPASVYDSPDVGVAFAKRGTRIIARAAVNRLSDSYARIYGNVQALEPWLVEQGIERDGDGLDGCRLRHIEEGGSIVMPYLDGAQGITIERGGWCRVGHYGEYQASSQSGLLNTSRCEDCGEPTHEDELRYIECAEQHLCESCVDHGFTYAVIGCSPGGRYREFDYAPCDEVYLHNGEHYTGEGLYACNLHVLDCGTIVSADEIGECYGSGDVLHIDDLGVCAHDSETYHRDVMVEAPDGERVFRGNLEDYISDNELAEDDDGDTDDTADDLAAASQAEAERIDEAAAEAERPLRVGDRVAALRGPTDAGESWEVWSGARGTVEALDTYPSALVRWDSDAVFISRRPRSTRAYWYRLHYLVRIPATTTRNTEAA